MDPRAYVNVSIFLDKFADCLKANKLNALGCYEKKLSNGNYCVAVIENKRSFAKLNTLMVFLELAKDDRFFSLIKIPYIIHVMKDIDFFLDVVLSASACFGYLPNIEFARMLESVDKDQKYSNDYFHVLWEVNEDTLIFNLIPRLDVFVESRMKPY